VSIPRHFHFVFGLKPQTEPFHLSHYLCLASCLEVNEPERLTLYYHHEPWGWYWDLIRDRIELVRVDLVPQVDEHDYDDRMIGTKYRYAHHADFVRVDQLLEHGGVYADIDTLFVAPYPDSFFEPPVVMGREDPVFCERTQRERPSVCNAVILAERGAPFLQELRRRMESAFDGTWSGHSCFLIHDLSVEMPDAIHLEEARSFFRFMWTREDLTLLFEGVEEDLDGVYSIHLWSHLWWERRRRDFSSFHAGKIHERRIRSVESTYNRLARPFLPPARRRWWGARG
jgi:hypothetical protein